MSFDIKLPGEALRTLVHHAFSKPSLVNLIPKTRTWYSIYQFTSWFTPKISDYDVDLLQDSSLDEIWLIAYCIFLPMWYPGSGVVLDCIVS